MSVGPGVAPQRHAFSCVNASVHGHSGRNVLQNRALGENAAWQLGANVLAACFVIDLPDLGGAERLRKLDVPVRTLISFAGH